MDIELTGMQSKALRDALVAAFPNYQEMSLMVDARMDKPLPEISPPLAMPHVAFDLIVYAKARGKLRDLILGARADNPGNPRLHTFVQQIGLAPLPRDEGSFEVLLNQVRGFQDVEKWRSRMAEVERTVCRIELPVSGVLPEGIGTGFLVADDLVMTNYHVVKYVMPGHPEKFREPHQMVVRFDYKRTADGKEPLVGVGYQLADDWLVDGSDEDDLDYALLRVRDSPGAQPVAGYLNAPPRGRLVPQSQPFSRGNLVLVIQHPQAKPMSFDCGPLKDETAQPPRWTYGVNTDRGSSGSPCLTWKWELVALHHWGAESGNRGIPFSAILKRMEKNGKLDQLALP